MNGEIEFSLVTRLYSIPKIGEISDLVATNSRDDAERPVNQGYFLFTVPQLFGEEKGQFVLYKTPESSSFITLEQYEQKARDYISGGSSSFGQVKESH